MKKINFLLLQLKTGGGVRVIVELANKAVEHGYDVSIIYPNIKEDNISFKIDKRVKLEKIGEKKIKVLNFFCFLHYIRGKKGEIIITTDPIVSIFSRIFPRKCRNIRFCQGDDYRIFDDLRILKNKFNLKIYKILTLSSYKDKNTEFIFNSKIIYRKFIENSKRKEIELKLIHPSVDNKIFYDKKIRKKNELNIGLIGRSTPMKGFKDFILAYDLLNKELKNKIDNVYIISHDDLSEFEIKKREKFKLIVPKNDIEIAEAYNRCHIFVSTSWFEGFGLPPLEAMKCGCAVINSDSKGVDEFAVEGENCLMFEPKNIEQLKDKLELLILDSKKREELQKGYMKLKKEFSTEDMYKQLELILLETN